MLRIYLDFNEGVSTIPCPTCGRPLLLAAERMGRWTVAYEFGFRVRPGRQVMLVCSGYECEYVEPIEIADKPDDAVILSASRAAACFQNEEEAWRLTLTELWEKINTVTAICRRTGNPKLPAAVRYWRERYSWIYSHVVTYLKRSLDEGSEVVCYGREQYHEQGRVRSLVDDGVMLERSSSGELVHVRLGDLHFAATCMGSRPRRFDFDGRDALVPGNSVQWTPRLHVVVGGYPLAFDDITSRGLCRVHTRDPEAARALGIFNPRLSSYPGEFPSVLVERTYLRLRYHWVQGHRLYLLSQTRDPCVLQLATHKLETARALSMRRQWDPILRRKALRWFEFFRTDEIEKSEEIQVPMRLPRRKRR